MDKHIHQLLHLHECVVIPDFGAFVLRYYPAELQEGTMMFRPPSRRVCFQPGLTVSDGILTHYIARKLSLSYRDAEAYIQREVREWKRQLASGHSIAINGVGKIYCLPGGNLEFFPELNTNFLRESYGLPIIRVKTPKASIAPKARPIEKSLVSDVEVSVFAPWMRRAVAVVLPLALALNMVSTSRSIQQSEAAMMQVEWKGSEHVKDAVEDVQTIEDTYDTDDSFIVADDFVTPDELPVIEKEDLVDIAPAAHIIVGAFSDINNAYKQVERLQKQGFSSAQLAGKSGQLNRVSAASFTSIEEARQALNEIRKNLDGGAWIYIP